MDEIELRELRYFIAVVEEEQSVRLSRKPTAAGPGLHA